MTARVLGVALILVLLLVAYNVTHYLIFWGPTESVRFASGDVSIACTFARPDDAGGRGTTREGP